MTEGARRVVTATGHDGRSLVASDAAARLVVGQSGPQLTIVWDVMTPAEYEAVGGEPTAFAKLPHRGARFLRFEVPGQPDAEPDALDVPMHRTDTIDLLYIAAGAIDLVTEASRVQLVTGDFLVMPGDIHGWRNSGSAPCVMVGVMLGAPARDGDPLLAP